MTQSQAALLTSGGARHNSSRLLPASATHSPPAGKVMACGQRRLAAVGAAPPFSSRCTKSVWPSTRLAGSPWRCGRPGHISTRRLPVSATHNRAPSQATQYGQNSVLADGLSCPRFDSPPLKSAWPSTTSGGWFDRVGWLCQISTRWFQASATTRPAPPAPQRAMPVGTFNVWALGPPCALRPSRSNAGWPISTSAGVWSWLGVWRQPSSR